jgi:hypothetical protein
VEWGPDRQDLNDPNLEGAADEVRRARREGHPGARELLLSKSPIPWREGRVVFRIGKGRPLKVTITR